MSLQLITKRYPLFIEGTATAGGGAEFKKGLRELLVKVVRHWPRDSLPGQDEDHQHSGVTVVPRPLAHQTQQLLLLTATPDYLLDDCAHMQTEKTSRLPQKNGITVTNTEKYQHKIMDPCDLPNLKFGF